MSLARATDDPVLKHRYQDLALEFAQNAGDERDFDITVPLLTTPKPKPSSGSISAHK
jgi:hypothetical protein